MKAITNNMTEGQLKQYRRFVEDAAEKALKKVALDKDGLQKLIENGDEFQDRIVTAVQELSVSNQYADEETSSNYGYLSGYKPKSIAEQVNILRQLFPNVGFADEKIAEQPLPPNAEGWFAIPKWQTIAPTYGEAVEKVLEAIEKTRSGKFCNYREGQLGPKYLRQSQKSVKAFEKFGEEQKDHDILVVPAQFGLRHRGRSVRRACEVMNASEFGLGAFAIGIMILTHPERLQHYDDLWIDCGGDEYSPVAGDSFSRAPYFKFFVGRVEFDARYVDIVLGRYGSASGFLPQDQKLVS